MQGLMHTQTQVLPLLLKRILVCLVILCCCAVVGFNLLPSGTVAEAAEPASILLPEDFEYLGAFRLPEGGLRPRTFAYGGNAMTFHPDGDPAGLDDGFPGSLFVMGHERMPYGELPDGNQVAEITIPVPTVADSPSALPQAVFLQDFSNVAAHNFSTLDEIPRVGMAYLNTPTTGPKIHLAWGQHFQQDEASMVPSHAWIAPNLANPGFQGAWWIGEQSLYSVNGYLLTIPEHRAQQLGGRMLATGRFRDGGWSGMGPSLFAYQPWLDDSGTPAPTGTHLKEVTLLLYRKSTETDQIEGTLSGYQHPDEWEGAAWLTTASGKEAVVFAGTKGVGEHYWYGFTHPAGPDRVCVDADSVGQFPVCRHRDGTPCPVEELVECAGHSSNRGWWSNRFEAQIIFYNPDELIEVARGERAPWEPQPYATLSLDDVLFHNPAGIEPDMLGTGIQRRYRLGDMAYDQDNGLLYLLELFADEDRPVVHVWRIH